RQPPGRRRTNSSGPDHLPGMRRAISMEVAGSFILIFSDVLPTPARLSCMQHHTRLPHIGDLEMRVLDDAKQVAEGIPHRRHLDATAHIFPGLVDLGSQGGQASQFGSGIWDPPEYLHAGDAGLAIWDQPQLEAADREADIERLIEVWVAPEHLA